MVRGPRQCTIRLAIVLSTVSACLPHSVSAAVSADSLARIVLAKAGIRAGVCELPRVGDGSLAVALVKQGVGIVHGLAPDAASTSAAQQYVDQNNVSSAKVIVETGAAAKIPLGDWVADLYAAADVSDADLASLPASEVTRVVAPYRGKAVVGQPVGGKGGLTASGLTTWAHQVDPSAVVTQDGQGTWAVMTAGSVPGADDWGQWFYRPDNNGVSADSSVRWPLATQWLGEPFHAPQPAMTLVSAGRIFEFHGRGTPNAYGTWDSMQATLSVRSAYNGSVLWGRSLAKSNYGVFRSCAVATPTTLYMADTAGPAVLMLDPETGANKGRITFTGVTGDIKWLALDSAKLCILAGDVDPPMLPEYIYDEANYKTGEIPWGFGKQIAVYDLQSRTVSWTHSETAVVDSRNMGIAAGRLFFYAPGVRFGCLSLTNGNLVWDNHDPAVLSLLGDAVSIPAVQINRVATGTRCNSQAVTFTVVGHQNLLVLSAASGGLLWSKNISGNERWGFLNQAILGSDLLLGTDNMAYDLMTGAQKTGLGGAGTCGRTTYNVNAIFGQGGLGYDLKAKASTNNGNGLKSSCHAAAVPADGVMFGAPHACTCPVAYRGAIAYRSADTVTRNGATGTLEIVSTSATIDPLDPGTLDWPTSRGSLSRAGALSASIPLPAAAGWQYVPAMACAPTAVAVVGEYYFFGADDGVVRCLNAYGGLLWSCHTGGAIRTAPTVALGRVYIGSQDGYLYAFAAKSGALLWRYRLAARQRRLMLYGRLTDDWAITSVMVKDSIVYASAGVNKMDGAYVCALDARSGALMWQRSIGDIIPQSWRSDGAAAVGNMTIARNHLVINGGFFNSPVSLKLSTGALAGADWRGNRSSQAGILRGGYAFLNGPTLFRYEGERQSVNQTEAALFAMDDTGAVLTPEVELSDRSLLTPAWDDNAVVLNNSGGVEGLVCLDAVKVTAVADTLQKVSNPTYPWTRPTKKKLYNDSALVQSCRLWSISDRAAYSVALTPAYVVVAYASLQLNSWGVCALNRSNGQSAWQASLPSEPVIDGLSIAATGRIVVPLKNGTIKTFFGGATSVVQPASPQPAVASGAASRTGAISARGFDIGVAGDDMAAVLRTGTAAEPAPTAATNDGPQPPLSTSPTVSLAGTLPVGDTTPAMKEWLVRAAQPQPSPREQELVSAACRTHDMTWHPDRQVLAIASVKASSAARGCQPSATVDRNLATRWIPASGGTQSITYDLGTTQEVSAVSVVWYSIRACRAGFVIEASTDGRYFEKVDEGVFAGHGTNTALRSFVTRDARYVRIRLDAPVSLYEVGIHSATTAAAAMSLK